MNINNGNYEEYFLLYADNELTPAQRKIVEMFVKANPHLNKEWDELMATKQEPDNISLADKSFLLKRPVDGFIDLYNYDKRFVEYHDGALSEQEKIFVQHFLTGHPALQREFDLIGQSYLSADEAVVFPEKTTLYRKSAVVRYGLFIRIAAAAVFIGFVVWLGVQLAQDQHPPRSVVQNMPSVEIPETIPPEQQPVVKKSSLAEDKSKKPLREKTVTIDYVKTTTPADVKKDLLPPLTGQNEESTVPEEATAMVTGIPNSHGNIVPDIIETETVSDLQHTIVHTAGHNDVDAVPEKELSQSYTASFSQEQEEDNYVFTDIPAENLQRSKLGIFIKKVKRTIDRNNPINRIFNGEED